MIYRTFWRIFRYRRRPSSMEHYDVIVSGAGLAGLASARTLIQNGVSNVLVLEGPADFFPLNIIFYPSFNSYPGVRIHEWNSEVESTESETRLHTEVKIKRRFLLLEHGKTVIKPRKLPVNTKETKILIDLAIN